MRRHFVIFIFLNYKRKAGGFVVIPARGGGREGGAGAEAGRVAILVAAAGEGQPMWLVCVRILDTRGRFQNAKINNFNLNSFVVVVVVAVDVAVVAVAAVDTWQLAVVVFRIEAYVLSLFSF